MLGQLSSGHLCRRPCSCFSHAVRAALRLLLAILPVTRWTSWHVCRWSPASLVVASFVSSALQAHPQPTLPPLVAIALRGRKTGGPNQGRAFMIKGRVRFCRGFRATPAERFESTGENPVGYPQRDRLRFDCAMALPPPALFSSRKDLPQHFWHSLHKPNIFDTIRTEPSFFDTGTF